MRRAKNSGLKCFARTARAGLLTLSAAASLSALAQTGGKMPDFYKEPGLYPNRDYTNQHFGEHIDPFTGALQLHYTDIFIPGNGGFNLAVQRSYNSASVDKSQPKHNSLMGVGWSMHFGRVTKAGTGGICTNDDWTSSTDNPVLEMPDGSTQRLYFTSSGSPLMLTQRRWKAECAPITSPGLIVYATDGTRYDMTKQISEGGFAGTVNAYYTTKITDRNGNYATINYTSNSSAAEISSISANDGRSITFSYADSGTAWRRVSSITGPSGTWYYNYTAISGLVNTYQLTGVTRPVTGNWSYTYNGNTQPSAGSHQMSSLTMPQGSSINYTYQNVSVDSASGTSVSMISTKSANGSWSWSFSPATSNGTEDTTTVSTPAGTHTYKHWGPNGVGNGDVWKIGLLTYKSLGSVQSETYTWDKLLLVDEPNSRDGTFSSKQDADTFQPVLTKKVISRSSTSFTTNYGSFDAYGNPASISETGPNGGNRSTTASYFNSTSKWIIGFLKDESRTGGQNVTRSYDSNGNLQSISRDGVTYGYSYNSDGSVWQMSNPRGQTTSYSSISRGIPQSETRPAGVSVSRSVDSAGNVTSETVGGQTFGYGYDEINRVKSITYPTGSAVSISYGSASKTATRGTLTESTTYNGYGYVTGVTLGGIARTYGVDALGRRTSETNPGGGGTTNYTYDILGRVTNVSNQDSTSRSISYGGSSAYVTDEEGNSTTYDYRSYGDPSFQALISISSPKQATSIGRNDRDLISAVTQGGKTRTYGYNSQYYLTSIIDPETGTTTYGRDAMGNMTSRAVGSSGTTTYTYDGLDRMTQAIYPGSITINKTYNGRGRLLSVTGGAGDRAYTYDGNDNLATEAITVDSQTFTATYAYNTLDQLSSVTYPKTSRTVDYAPSALGRPSKVGTYVTNISYHNSGQVNTITYANGTTTTYGQNSRLWPGSFSSSKSGNFINSTYGYDGVGNLTSISDSVDASLNRTLGYDGIGRLTSASGPWGTGTFTYDDVGNLTNRTYAGVATTYTYDTSNRLSTMTGQRTGTFNYGNYASISSDGANTYTYDGVPNLTCVNCADTLKKIEYRYDGTNTRIARKKGGVTTYEFNDAKGNLLFEYTPADNDKTVEHIYLGNKRVAQRTNDTTIPKTATTTTLSANPTSASCGTNTTLTATVTAGATGAVEFFDSGVSLGTATLSGTTATLTLSLPRPGSRSITAQYLGNATYDSSASTAVSVNVSAVANAITLSYSPAPPYSPTTPVTLTATVSGCVQGNGSIRFETVAAGTVSQIPTATIPLTGRTASYTLTPGFGLYPYYFRATLIGDGIATNNIYADGDFTVHYNSTVTITSITPNPVGTGQAVDINFQVGSNHPTGTAMAGNVTLYNGTTQIGTVYLDDITLPYFWPQYSVPTTPGTYPITATFGGDSRHYAGTSAVYNLVVLPATTTTVSASPTTITIGQASLLTAQVTSSAGIPTGTVSFYDGTTLLGAGTLSNGQATYNATSLLAGARQIKAVYSGSAAYATSTSIIATVTVNKATPVVTITSLSPNAITAFSNTTITATVTGTPTPPAQSGLLVVNGGAIDVMIGGAGTLNVTTNRIPAGTYQVVARYPATANFNQADSAPWTLTVTGSACKLDVNRSNAFDEPDGRAILAWLLGFRGTNLATASQNTNGLDGPGIDAFIKPQALDLTLDLDGDGKVNATTDGLMLLRIALGLTGTAVTNNAINPAGTRPDWTSVRNYVNTTCGLSLQ